LLAQKKNIQIAPAPTWITTNAIDYSNTKWDEDAEDGYVDLAYERQVSLGLGEMYSRKVVRIISDAGVQNSSEINIGFDPAYESLTFHAIRILRGKEVLNKLDRSKFKILQQEQELDKYLYDGSLSAVLFLEDVRKGDVIEYSYTRKGFNPIFKNKYTGTYSGNFSVPVGLLYYKLIVPRGRTIKEKVEGSMGKSLVTQNENETVYEWKETDVPALHLEEKLPTWYDPYSYVNVTEFTSWKEVTDWALALYPKTVSLSPALHEKIAAIKKQYTSPEEQVVAALRFVQDEVRYLGMEMGEGSHRPNNPNKVFAQRFGDCKDKSYLLITMLHAMNVEAYPVLINTEYKAALLKWLPSPTAFDHVTVQVKLGGKTYWFDPTSNYQRGAIHQISFPDYQCGLVISPQTTSLSTIPLQDVGKIAVKEKFIVKDKYSPVRFLVTTTYTGSKGDYMRNDFASSSMREMRKSFEDFYKGYFKELKIDSLKYTDNEASGEFITQEWYTIPDFWEKDGDGIKASLAPFMINAAIKTPENTKRAMPFALSYPSRYTEDVIVELPNDWDITNSSDEFKNEHFLLALKVKYNDRVLQLHYNYETYKDHVAPDALEAYVAAIEAADNEIGFGLTWGTGYSGAGSDSSVFDEDTSIYTRLYVLLGVCVLITMVVRWIKRQNGGWR
jgi:transglutaminase-like putative cysteine protease